VPALRHHGRAIYESTVICEYLDEVFPTHPSLTPVDALDRAAMRAWLRYIDEVPSMAIRVPSFRRVFLPHFQKMTEEEFRSFADSNPLRRGFFLKMGQSGFSDDDYSIAMDQLSKALARMNKALDQHEYLCGAGYTIADACTIPTIVRIEDIGIGELLSPHSNVMAWYKRCQARPSFAEAFYEGTRISNLRQGYASFAV
jgi:glutathione S-transferase